MSMPSTKPTPSAPASAPPSRLTDRKRLAIVEAAIGEFRANGFEATSMDKIAASAGVSKRTVYNHFPSKDELFAEILARLWESSSAHMGLPYRPDLALRPQLLALMKQKMRMLNDPHFVDLARIAIAETIHAPERAQAMVARMGDREEGVAAWIRAAQADGKLKPADAEFASHLIQGQIKAFALWPQVTMGQSPLAPEMQQQVVEAAVGMFLAYYANTN
jgi:TetR/AcrR family transcriptional regulator, regulator of autoinduction and epiphytic fitness